MNSANRLILKNTNIGVSTKNNLLEHSYNNFKTNRFVSKQVNEERNKKQREDEFVKSLDCLTTFPELQTKKNIKKHTSDGETETTQTINFVDAMKMKNDVPTKTENSSESENSDYVPPGCVCIKYDKVVKKPVWIYGKNTNNFSSEKKQVTEEDEDPRHVFQRLVNLHQNRKYEYIRNWGIDEYDKMFLYQNYDYEYFDKLDEQIEMGMEKYYQNNSYNFYNNNCDYNLEVDND
jgi:hypothetical protein